MRKEMHWTHLSGLKQTLLWWVTQSVNRTFVCLESREQLYQPNKKPKGKFVCPEHWLSITWPAASAVSLNNCRKKKTITKTHLFLNSDINKLFTSSGFFFPVLLKFVLHVDHFLCDFNTFLEGFIIKHPAKFDSPV